MKIVTNNKNFIGYEKAEVEYVDDSYLEVFERARNYIHKNYKLLTHPLYGNITPTSTVYRSLIIEEGKSLDFQSVELIENAITKVERIINTDKIRPLTDEIRKDLEFIDFTLISETLEHILVGGF